MRENARSPIILYRVPDQVSSQIIYEQPLNERIRAFLRLEFLFKWTRHHLAQPSPWDSRAALASILDILSILSRTELKSELIKELERHAVKLSRLERNPEVDRDRLESVLDELDALVDNLHTVNGQIAQDLKHNDFLVSIRQRGAIPGGTCDFDLPAYHYWLQLPADQRQRDLAAWFVNFETVAKSIRLILQLTRESSQPQKEIAAGGFFQRNLDPAIPCQMVRVALPVDSPYYAAISGGRHRFTVRLLEQNSDQDRAVQATEDVEFHLSCCVV